jgi:hypothetical protein
MTSDFDFFLDTKSELERVKDKDQGAILNILILLCEYNMKSCAFRMLDSFCSLLKKWPKFTSLEDSEYNSRYIHAALVNAMDEKRWTLSSCLLKMAQELDVDAVRFSLFQLPDLKQGPDKVALQFEVCFFLMSIIEYCSTQIF